MPPLEAPGRVRQGLERGLKKVERHVSNPLSLEIAVSREREGQREAQPRLTESKASCPEPSFPGDHSLEREREGQREA